ARCAHAALYRRAVEAAAEPLCAGRGHAGAPEVCAPHRHAHGVDAALPASQPAAGSWCSPLLQARLCVCQNRFAPGPAPIRGRLREREPLAASRGVNEPTMPTAELPDTDQTL